METLHRLGIRRLEIYDSKTVISTFQISAVLAKFILEEFAKELKLRKVVAISR